MLAYKHNIDIEWFSCNICELLRHVQAQLQTSWQFKTTSYPEAQYQRYMVFLWQVRDQMQDPWTFKTISCQQAQHRRSMCFHHGVPVYVMNMCIGGAWQDTGRAIVRVTSLSMCTQSFHMRATITWQAVFVSGSVTSCPCIFMKCVNCATITTSTFRFVWSHHEIDEVREMYVQTVTVVSFVVLMRCISPEHCFCVFVPTLNVVTRVSLFYHYFMCGSRKKVALLRPILFVSTPNTMTIANLVRQDRRTTKKRIGAIPTPCNKQVRSEKQGAWNYERI